MDGTTLLLVVILIILVILLVLMFAGDGVTRRVHRHMREINDAIKASDEVDDDDETTEAFGNREFAARRMFDGSDCDNIKGCPSKKHFKETSYKRSFEEVANDDAPMQSTTANSLLKNYTKSTLPPLKYDQIKSDNIQRVDKTNVLTVKDNRTNASNNRGEVGCGSIRVDNGETYASDKADESVPLKFKSHTYKFNTTEGYQKNNGKGMMRSTIINSMSRPYIFEDR